MALTPGTRLGPYEVTAHIGEGGMGQVWRATDTTLGRQVAIKILPDAFASDPERLARFEREAKTLASLNHPHIAAIHGFEKFASTGSGEAAIWALVMELVEGEDLSTIIARHQHSAPAAAGPSESASRGTAARGGGAPRAMSIEDALPIARQIAEALEAAHEQGIIHRDLKPANIKIKPDGTVKVLDFGLAKAMDPAGASNADVMNSPTLTARATQAGMILGTAAYMSPEQAKGRAVDKRADIWAFGVVLYEMLTGRRAFEGDDVSDTLASVLKDTPSMDALPAATPPRLTRLIARCLDRDLKTRLRDIGEARIEIARIEAGAEDRAITAIAASSATPRSAWSRALPWALVTALVVALVASLLAWAPWRTAPAPTPRKLLASIGADASLVIGFGASVILSPDATTLAFVAQQDGLSRLFVRKLDELQATALAGTEDAASPFFSPNGQWIAFFAGGKLKKVSVTGGAAIALCDVPSGRGGTWTDDDTIIFTPSSVPNTALMRVPATGGAPSVFGTLGQGAVTQRWPQVLPTGTSVLYTEHSATGAFDGANLVVAPMAGGPPKIVLQGGYHGRYVRGRPSSPTRDEHEGGHLIYMNRGTLFAVRFDLDRLETIGQAVPAIEGIATISTAVGSAQLAFSSEGTLVYVPGQTVVTNNPINWLTPDGKTSALRATKATWRNPRFSPDGQTLAIDLFDGVQWDIWVYAWTRDTLTQLTFDPREDRHAVWTPDGRRLVFASDRAKPGTFNLYWVNADGTGEVTRLTDSPDSQTPSSWHPSAKLLAFDAARGATGERDLMILPMEGDAGPGWTPGTPTVFLSTPANEGGPIFSPDGRWIAYNSPEAASIFDVYVRPFPGPGSPWRISTGGGMSARWSASTHELLFVNPFNQDLSGPKIMAAPYAVAGGAFRAETAKVWSPTSMRMSLANDGYDLHPDGRRVTAAAAENQSGGVRDHVVFVFNFADYLATIAPSQRP